MAGHCDASVCLYEHAAGTDLFNYFVKISFQDAVFGGDKSSSVRVLPIDLCRIFRDFHLFRINTVAGSDAQRAGATKLSDPREVIRF